MAMDVAFLLNKLQEAPAGFGFCDVGEWLQDVEYIQTLTAIEPIFFEPLTSKALLALFVLVKQRYLKEGPAYNLFDDHFQQYIAHTALADCYKALYLYGDVSQSLDFSPLKTELTKLVINNGANLTEIIFPLSKKLEALELANLPKLTDVVALEKLTALKYLAINHCPKLVDFSFIKKIKKLWWLDLSDNPQLADLNFLLPSHQLVVLQLLGTDLLENPKTVKQLTKLTHLKYLSISAKQSQLAELRELLPHCMINGMSAIINA